MAVYSPEVLEVVECPCCGKSFPVVRYGRRIPCPHCRERLDIFPDPVFQANTEWGGFTIGFLQPGFFEEIIADAVKKAAGEILSPANILKKIIGK